MRPHLTLSHHTGPCHLVRRIGQGSFCLVIRSFLGACFCQTAATVILLQANPALEAKSHRQIRPVPPCDSPSPACAGLRYNVASHQFRDLSISQGHF